MTDIKKLQKLAKLSRIEINNPDHMLDLINQDINGVKSIYDINTDGLEPLNNPYDIELVLNDDVVQDGDKQEELMKCAPNSMYNYYIVPKVVE